MSDSCGQKFGAAIFCSPTHLFGVVLTPLGLIFSELFNQKTVFPNNKDLLAVVGVGGFILTVLATKLGSSRNHAVLFSPLAKAYQWVADKLVSSESLVFLLSAGATAAGFYFVPGFSSHLWKPVVMGAVVGGVATVASAWCGLTKAMDKDLESCLGKLATCFSSCSSSNGARAERIVYSTYRPLGDE